MKGKFHFAKNHVLRDKIYKIHLKLTAKDRGKEELKLFVLERVVFWFLKIKFRIPKLLYREISTYVYIFAFSKNCTKIVIF